MKGAAQKTGAQPSNHFVPNEIIFITHWIDLGCGICLQLKLDDRGWGWHAWAEGTTEGWWALPAPARVDTERRFSTEAQAVCFFEILAKHPRHVI